MPLLPQKSRQRAPHFKVGADGEDLAASFLQRLGYAIIDRNVRVGKDEIDIIAFDPRDAVIVFVEVKSRSRRDPNFPASSSARWRKMQKIRRAARRWVTKQDFDGGYRFDLVCVEGGRVTQHGIEV